MAPRIYRPYTNALVEDNRRWLIAQGYRPAAPPGSKNLFSVPLFSYHGKHYYRPHHACVLGYAASVQLHKESYEDFEKHECTGQRPSAHPKPPSPEKLRFLVFVQEAPRSWWKNLNPYRAHILTLQHMAGTMPEAANVFWEWLLTYTIGTNDSTG